METKESYLYSESFIAMLFGIVVVSIIASMSPGIGIGLLDRVRS